MSPPATRPADENVRAREPILSRHRTLLGSSVQVAVIGVYTWAVTVAPAAWSMGATVAVKAVALFGLLALGVAPLAERAGASKSSSPSSPSSRDTTRSSPAPGSTSTPLVSSSPLLPLASRVLRWCSSVTVRSLSFWSFVLSSAAVWALAPSSFATAKFDGLRGALGVVGWLLYAFAWAGPSLDPSTLDAAPAVPLSPLAPEAARTSRMDDVGLAFGLLLSLGLQVVGWSVTSPERAVLVRIVTVASGIALFSTTATVLLARRVPRVHAAPAVRLRRALPWMFLLALFGVTGALFLFEP